MLLQRSEKRKQASRANGARSRGPKTPEGKLRSSRNALRHGLLSTRSGQEPQSLDDFNQLRDSYTAHFNPRDIGEALLVDRLAATFIRRRRIWALEAALVDPAGADFAEYALLQRYDSHLARVFHRAFSDLQRSPKPHLYQTNLEHPVFATNPLETALPNDPLTSVFESDSIW